MLEKGVLSGGPPSLPGRGPAPELGCLAGVFLAGTAEPLIDDHRVAIESAPPEAHGAPTEKTETARPAVVLK